MRGLVLGGGGSYVAFQVGVLKRLMEESSEWYRAFSGISAGAINALFLSQYTDKQAVKDLIELWENIKIGQIKKRWFPFGKLHIIWEGGLYDLSPLRNTINKHFDHYRLIQSGNHLRIGAVNLSNLEYEVFDEQHEDLQSVVMGSMSLPPVLGPNKIGDHYYIDGAFRRVTPIKSVMKIPEITEIDVISAFCVDKYNFTATKNIFNVGKVSVYAVINAILNKDINTALLHKELHGTNRKLKIRIFEPKDPITYNPVKFQRKHILDMIENGYDKAKITVIE